MGQIENIISQYIAEIVEIYQRGSMSGSITAELSFRPALDAFLKKVSGLFDDQIGRVFEPSNQGLYGRPDWLFYNTQNMGIFGYVEAKPFSPDHTLEAQSYGAQIKKYLSLGNPVILTDGIDFIKFDTNGTTQSLSLCVKPISRGSTGSSYSEIFDFFHSFFKEVGFRRISERQLVAELSCRAISLCEDIEEILGLSEEEAENEVERTTIVSLHNLWQIAQTKHDKTLSDDHNFASFIAQILAFGLLYAHRCINEKALTPKEKYVKLQAFWNAASFRNEVRRLVPFKTLVDALSRELTSPFSKLGLWYDSTRRMLSCIQLMDSQRQSPDFHELYEAFLSKYDGRTRTDFGAWYTPMCLANYTTRFVESILPSVTLDEEIVGLPYKVIDPCCGTGSFLEAVLENMRLAEGSQIIGFEILPVPYALANYRVSMLCKNKKSDIPDIEIVLTNTLSDCTFKQIRVEGGATDAVSTFFIKEQRKAGKLSKTPLTVIVGNPPCSDSNGINNEGSKLKKLMEDFRPDREARGTRSNKQKQVVNEFTKFLRWTLYKAEQSRPSVFAMIIPSAFSSNISYLPARKYLLEHVSELWVLVFDTDLRAGHQAQNLFNTRQGRMLLVGSFRELSFEMPTIHYLSISGFSKKEKQEFFNSAISFDEWETIEANSTYSLCPIKQTDEVLYNRFWPIASSDTKRAIFMRHCSGLKLAPTHLLVHFSKGQLTRRCRFIADENNTYEAIVERWYTGQTKAPKKNKLTNEVRAAFREERSIVNYSYRPFLSAAVVLDQNIIDALKKTPGEGLRDRPEIRAAFMDSSVFGFAVAPAPAEIDIRINKFTSFCWGVPDNDLVSRGTAQIFCNRFPDYKKNRDWRGTIKSNINPELISILALEYKQDKNMLGDSMVYYAYAILNAPFYLESFTGKLYVNAGDFPSIPITADWDLFNALVEVGKNMANAEKNSLYLSEDEIFAAFVERPYFDKDEYELYGYNINKEEIRIIDSHKDVVMILRIREEILKFSSSGYNVIREWLKYHKYAYYRKNCTQQDMLELCKLAGRIQFFLKQQSMADALAHKICKGQLI